MALSPLTRLVAVANTGPMISAFQCGRVDVLQAFFEVIHVAESTVGELQKHGAWSYVQPLMDSGLVVVNALTVSEKLDAEKVAQRIAASPTAKDRNPLGHLPDAEAIVLVNRAELGARWLILDELAAREVAALLGLSVIGFPGLLGLACEHDLMTEDEVLHDLLACQRLGTFYSTAFIHDFYENLKGRKKHASKQSETGPRAA